MHPIRRFAIDRSFVITAALALAVAPLLLAACSSAPEWAGTIEERDGVVYVENPAEPMWSGRETPPLRFELEQSYGSDGFPEEAMLGNPFGLGVAADEHSNVYVLDPQISRLVAFDADGGVRWTAGRAGEGPGELNQPSGLALNGAGLIAIMNQRRTRIDLWDTAGEYVGAHTLEGPPLDVEGARFPSIAGFVNPDWIVLNSPTFGTLGSRTVVVDLSQPAVVGDFAFDPLPGFDMPNNVASGSSVATAGGAIWVASSADYRFRVYSAERELLREVTRPFQHTLRSGVVSDGGFSGIMGFGGVSAPMPLASDHLLVSVSWTEGIDDPDAAARDFFAARREDREPPELVRGRALDLYDGEGRFLYSYREDDAEWAMGTIRFVGPDDRLYTVADDPFPQVRRYRVIIEEG
jgi:hypothetical protein